MDYINLLLFMIIIAPISMIIHEIGHLIGAKCVKADSIILTLGTGKKLFTVRFNQTTFIIRFFLLFNPQIKSMKSEGFTKKELIIISFFGPLLNVLLAILSYMMMTQASPTYLLTQ